MVDMVSEREMVMYKTSPPVVGEKEVSGREPLMAELSLQPVDTGSKRQDEVILASLPVGLQTARGRHRCVLSPKRA